MDDTNKKQGQNADQTNQVQNPASEVPENIDATSDETPIEVPNDPADHPVEEAVAKESMTEEKFEEEVKATEEVEAPVKEEAKEEEIEAKAEESQEVEEEKSVRQAQDEPAKEEKKEVVDEHPGAKWYIIHTYSGHENRVQKSLKQRIQSLGFEDRIFDIIVPTRNTIKVSQGKKESIKEKIFPGYVLVKMILDDESWLLVRTTQGVTAFIGAGNKPTPISEKEVEAIQKFMNAEEPLYKTSFSVGEAVKITDGPFNDFLGTIDQIDDAKGKIKVLVSIFGRETPVELDFLQVKKL